MNATVPNVAARFATASKALALVVLVVVLRGQSVGCSWSKGYFEQVTRLRGHVVGKDLKILAPLQYIRWLRQSFDVAEADLLLLEYRWPVARREDMPEIARVKADKDGWFDFGQLKPGHYTLILKKGDLEGSFDVEVNPAARETEYVLVDISPHFPDCKGGHEFIVHAKPE